MKAKVSWLSGALLVIVLNVAVLLVSAGVSARLASGSASFRQGGGRPTPTTRPTRVVRRMKRHTPRPHPTNAAARASSSNAVNANHGDDATVRNAVDNGNANNSSRPPATEAVGNTGNDNSSNAVAPSSTPTPAEPAAESKTQPAPADTSSPPKTTAKPNPDADILLPDDFRRLESGPYLSSTSDPVSHGPSIHRPKPGKLFNTTGTLSEIANERKVFVNIRGEYGDKVTARLKAYGSLEVVKTAGEAEFAVSYYDWAAEQKVGNPTSPLGVWEAGTKSVTGGTLIITTRDPLERVPRVIWRKDDTDGGWFKRGDAVDKLTKRFVNELKKLRGGK